MRLAPLDRAKDFQSPMWLKFAFGEMFASLAKKYEFAQFCSYLFERLHGWETYGNQYRAKYFGQKL
jgi:hypothetical protein